jgi:hypothetical protein
MTKPYFGCCEHCGDWTGARNLGTRSDSPHDEPCPDCGVEIEIEATQGDPESVPWIENCLQCEGLHQDPQPGLWTWTTAVGVHFLTAHSITLINPPSQRMKIT